MTDKMMSAGPPALTINKGSIFLVTDQNGEIAAHEAQGLFAEDTRFLSVYRLGVNGQPWERVSAAATAHDAARIYLTNPRISSYSGETVIEPEALTLAITRIVDQGLHETLVLANHGQDAAGVILELQIESDFSDLFEVKLGKFRQRPSIATEWRADDCALVTSYRRDDYFCCFRYQVVDSRPRPTYANGRLLFEISLPAGTTWAACGHLSLEHGRTVHRPPCLRRPSHDDEMTQLQQRWLSQCTHLDSSDLDLNETYRQSVQDMSALRLYERDLGPDVWVAAAGVPWFVTLFGRDSLIASIQNMSVNPRFAEGTLRVLADHQATERDDWRDAQPGKIVHEVRHGELAHFNEVPHTRYYGTWDATPLFVMALHQAWRWLGDRRLVEELLPAAERCLAWIDSCGDLDGDGFQEYQTYSPKGYENMGWKDAHDAVVYPDGRQVKQPKALCELQGYVYAAKQAMAELYRDLERPAEASQLEAEATTLKRRFDQAFWVEADGFYAFGLDRDKQPIRTITSNPGQCLWTGIVEPSRAPSVVARLLGGDMWSGWGIRTLSAVNPAYNPISYQLGSVWPHDNGIIAAGMKRYGFAGEANQVARGILDAARHYQSYRLPELFAGVARQPHSFPVQYRGANSPQAWAAGAVFQLVAAILGLEADAPHGLLRVDPTLPEWLTRVELTGLRVGSAMLDLRFWREGNCSRFEVLRQEGGEIRVELAGVPA
ncbi:MAG TPA: glycogen debranching N-terminal domain-containing protein [Chloroflexota bacterium]|nr:glycogen debranching N-terminal domain-containing protein [Chloroflexota bacterium]